MKIVVERVKEARVLTDGTCCAEIKKGLLLLVGLHKDDSLDTSTSLIRQILQLRIFEDSHHKMNLSAADVNAEILVVPNFTLAADLEKGHRPSFDSAMEPDAAKALFEEFIVIFKKQSTVPIVHGIFGARMDVSIVNHGPVTFVLEG